VKPCRNDARGKSTSSPEGIMKRSSRRAWIISAACVAGFLGSLLVTSAASAVTFSTTARTRQAIMSSPGSGVQTGTNLVNDPVTDFCRVGSSDMIWNRFTGRRAGYVPRSSLNDTGQFTDCSSGGFFAQVGRNTNQRSCSDAQCTGIRLVEPADSLRAYCQQTGGAVLGNTKWYLIFNADGSNSVGYVPAADMSVQPNIAVCA
jgi:hypothetical protein